MSIYLKPLGFACVLLALSFPVLAMRDTLSLKQAVTIAIDRDDPSIGAYIAMANAKEADAIADSQLPDPKVKFGIANIATDSFRFSQEAMTHLQLGVHQSFISSSKRQLMRERGRAGGEAYRLMARKRALIITLEVERLWLNLKHLEIIATIVNEKKARLMEMHMAHEAKYESGFAAVQDILAMDAELALLDDRLEELEQELRTTRVGLARYIGDTNADKPLGGSYRDVTLPQDLASLEAGLEYHPDLLQEKAMIHAGEKSVSLAKENYKPNWGLDLGYGARSGGRSDMATAMVTFDVPLFTAKRQDKRLLAAKLSKQSSMLKLRAKEMDMLRNVRAAYVTFVKSNKRIGLYNTVVLERTKAASLASENSYASGSTDFAEIIRTHLSELDARLKLEAIKLQRAAAQVELNYFRGETS